MKLFVRATILVALVLPCRLNAQVFEPDRPSWGPRLRLTPFVGFAPTVTRTERWVFAGPGYTAEDTYRVDLAYGMAAGGTLELRVIDRFALVGSAAYVSRGKTVEVAESTLDEFRHTGSNFLMAKAALALRLREPVSDVQVHRLTGSIFVGPAYIRETPRADPYVPDPVLLQPQTYTGLNFGFDLEMPMSSWITFQAGVEDYLFRWNDVEMARRNDVASGGTIQSYVETTPAHAFLLRAGISLHPR